MPRRSRYDLNEIHKNYMSTSSGRTRITFNRPKIKYKKVILHTMLIIMASVVSIWVSAILLSEVLHINNSAIIAVLIVLVTNAVIFGRWVAIGIVTVYQSRASIEKRMRCCFEPSCSEYAILAFEKYGLIYGGIKAIKRLKRCHPPGGIDYP